MADEDTAKGLVHRYLVMVRQNARQVTDLEGGPCSQLELGAQGSRARMAGGRARRLAAEGAMAGSGCLAGLQVVDLCLVTLLLLPQGNASTMTRGEVRGGGRKPYKQKGSGNARRGSKRSPLMPGGGISFGPKVR